MSGLFNIDSPFWRFLTKVTNLMILNILFVICCIPIITIGASISALYSVTFKLAANEEGSIHQDFFKSFKSNFKQATIIWVILLIIGVFLFFDFQIIRLLVSGKLYIILLIALCIIAILYAAIFSYIFPLQCKFENTTRNLFKNAFLISFMHLVPGTLIVVFLNVAPLLLMYYKTVYFFQFTPVILLLMFACIAYFNSKLLSIIFAYYTPAKEE